MRRVWWSYALVGGLVAAGYPLLPAWLQGPVYDAVGVSGLIAVLVAVRSHRPRPATAWYLFAVAQALYVAADALWNLVEATGHRVPALSPLDLLYLCYYPPMVAGLVLLVRRRGPRRQLSLVIDALLAAAAAAVVTWALIRPSVLGPGLSLPARLVNLLYPMADLALLVLALRLVIGPGRRSVSFRLLVTSLAMTTTADLGYLLTAARGGYIPGGALDVLWLCGYLAFGAAALHRSMRLLGLPGRPRSPRLGPGRVALLAVAMLVMPGFLTVAVESASPADAVAFTVGAAALCTLLLVRVVAVVRQLERAIARERILRNAGVAMAAAATDPEAIARIVADAAGRLVGPGYQVVVAAGAAAAGAAIPGVVRVPVKTADGDRRAIVVSGAGPEPGPLVLASLGTLATAAALAWDAIGREERRRREERKFRSIVEASSDVMALVSPEGVVRWVGESAERIAGYRPEDLLGRDLATLLHPEDAGVATYLAEALAEPGAGARIDARLRLADGSYRIFQVSGRNLLDDPDVQGMLLTGLDVTERRELADQLRDRAFRDPLTRLANRALLMDRLSVALARYHQDHRPVSVLFIGLDGFKTVNDSLGHQAGDLLLTEVAARVVAGLRTADTAARIGGDEFAVVIDDAGTEAATVAAERVLAALNAPFRVGDREVFTGASIGIAMADDSHEDPERLLRDADIAMHRAKAAGRGRHEAYQPSMWADAVRRLELQGDLQRALERGELVVYYQPIIDLVSNRPASFEALVRWRHPIHGIIAPDRFIPVAEETGMIVGIGRWVLAEACRQAVLWQARFGAAITMAVNISARQVAEGCLLGDVGDALRDSGLEPSQLTLELTESALMADIDLAAQTLQALRGIGVRIAIDDFGTGYSSLSYLDRLPVDIIKIDRSFVAALDDPTREPTLVRIMVDLAHSLNIPIVAEGIESMHQRDNLQQLGCPLGQGYLFAPPNEPRTIEAALDGHVPGTR